MVAHPAPLDAAFGFVLFATAQSSLIALGILSARASLRSRLSPGARYALWALLALPLLAPFPPAGPFHFPALSREHNPSPQPAPAPAPAPVADTGWVVEYGGIADVPAAARVIETPPMNWRRLAAVVWALGVGVFGGRVVFAHARAVLHARSARRVDDPDVVTLLDQCRARVGLRRVPRLVTAPPGAGPAVLGLLRPRVLLPAGAATNLSRAELRFVLLHELVHLKRGDVLAEWLLTLLQLGQWFNPLVWLAASRCRADREEACDAAVLALAGRAARTDYGRTILRLATELSLSPRPSPAVGILETRSSLERRLRMIADDSGPGPSRWPAAVVALLALALVAGTNAQSPAGKDAEPPGENKPATEADKAKQAFDQAFQEALKRQGGKVLSADESNRLRGKPDAEKSEPPKPEPQKRDAESFVTNELLSHKIPELNFNDACLTDVIVLLREVTGANIFVNWKALKEAGVERTTTVSARMRNIAFGKVLTVLLDSVVSKDPLVYAFNEGVITITTRSDLEKDAVTRVYDIRDLVVPIPDYEPPPAHDPKANAAHVAANAPGPVDGDAAGRTRQESIDRVTKLIRESVDPPAWEKTARMRELNGQLIVTAAPRLQQDVAGLIDLLRQARAVQVVLEARFLYVDDGVLAGLPADLRKAVEGELRAAKDPVRADPNEQTPEGKKVEPPFKDPSKAIVLDDKQVDRLLRAVQADPRSGTIAAPRMMLYSGQGGYLQIGSSQPYVSDYVVIKEDNGQTRFEPQMGVVQSGVMLWARATAGADRTFATLTLHPRLSRLAGVDDVPWEKSPAGAKLTVQRPNLLASELALTVSVPDGRTLLLGGLKGNAGKAGKGENENPQNVLLLVKPKLVLNREAEAKPPADAGQP